MFHIGGKFGSLVVAPPRRPPFTSSERLINAIKTHPSEGKTLQINLKLKRVKASSLNFHVSQSTSFAFRWNTNRPRNFHNSLYILLILHPLGIFKSLLCSEVNLKSFSHKTMKVNMGWGWK